MLDVPVPHTHKRVRGNFVGDGYVYGLDYSNSFTGACIYYLQTHQLVYIKYAQAFVWQS